jgi:S1-C subfamily serine protease
LLETFGIKPEVLQTGGVIITGVLQNGPAQAGLQPGDVITQVDNWPVANVSVTADRGGLKPSIAP